MICWNISAVLAACDSSIEQNRCVQCSNVSYYSISYSVSAQLVYSLLTQYMVKYLYKNQYRIQL